jgi:hypothetical protein
MTAIDAAPELQKPIGLCLGCNYPLWGLPTPRCPECGREFDPLDASTMNMGRELSPLARWALGPLRWPVSVLSWVALAYAIWMARLPGGQIAGSISIVILLSLGVLWLAWPILRYAIAKNHGWPHSLLMRGQKQRIIVGLVLLAASAGILCDLPLKLAMHFSRPAMDRMATDLLASNDPYADDQWLGVYKATRIKKTVTRNGPGVRITCEESNRAYRSGFLYLPNTNPKTTTWRGRDYHHVSGNWWAWREEG